jgi:Holliday junction resolvasome RuvABC endonuclease subunit
LQAARDLETRRILITSTSEVYGSAQYIPIDEKHNFQGQSPYAATKIKKLLTGSGHAPKDQMQRAIQLELQLPRIPEPPDVADALAVALCHFYRRRISVSPGK